MLGTKELMTQALVGTQIVLHYHILVSRNKSAIARKCKTFWKKKMTFIFTNQLSDFFI